ncbi:MAG: AMIN domain-containing protein [Polyangia bacterium]
MATMVEGDNVVVQPAALEALSRVGTNLAGKPKGKPKGNPKGNPNGKPNGMSAAMSRGPKTPPAKNSSQFLGTGFRSQRHGGEVRLRTSTAVKLEPRANKKNAAVFVLKGCRAGRRNDRFPLDTRYFDSAVTRVSVRQRGADLEVVVALRGPVTPLTRQEEDPSGNSVWVLEFPAATVALSP